MRLESHPTENATVLVNDSARKLTAAIVIGNTVVTVGLPFLLWFAFHSGPVEAFVSTLFAILVLMMLAAGQMPSPIPLVLAPRGITVRVAGASTFIHWDGIERVNITPYPGWNAAPALSFQLRPGVASRDLVRESGVLRDWVIKDGVAYVRGISPAILDEVLPLARSMHRERLAETSRLESPVDLTSPYPG